MSMSVVHVRVEQTYCPSSLSPAVRSCVPASRARAYARCRCSAKHGPDVPKAARRPRHRGFRGAGGPRAPVECGLLPVRALCSFSPPPLPPFSLCRLPFALSSLPLSSPSLLHPVRGPTCKKVCHLAFLRVFFSHNETPHSKFRPLKSSASVMSGPDGGAG